MKPAFLQTSKKTSLKNWFFKLAMNWYPMFLGTGGKVLFISSDWREVHIRLRLNLWTRNYVGTIFGGSMFSASDPFYMIMILKNLGDDYVVWDKSASIRFRRPAKKRIYAKYLIDEAFVEQVKADIAEKGEMDYVLPLSWVAKDGTVHASMERTVYVASKKFYKEKLAQRSKKETA